MELEYSPRHTGGSIHLLSPSHVHHAAAFDGFASIRQLRRSLSRSPSKPSRYSMNTTYANSGTPRAALPLNTNLPSNLSRVCSPGGAPFDSRPSASALRSAPVRIRPTRRTSPTSPLRRALSDNINNANSSPRFPLRRTSSEVDQENMDCTEDAPKPAPEPTRFDEPIKLDFAKPGPERLLQPVMREHASPMKSSPLKRSDGVMNLEVATLGSPRSNKRRSLHGPTLGADFNIFDHSFGLDGTHGDSVESADEKDRDKPPHAPTFNWSASATHSPQRRPSNLRKSTLQQRVGPGRKNLFADSARDSIMSPSLNRARSRISLDGALPLRSPDIDSPFRRSYTNEPPALFPPPAQKLHQSAPKPHPLSHALTPSSSAASITDSPHSQAPVFALPMVAKPGEAKMPSVYSKSLPIGATRPTRDANSSQGSEGSFTTPAGYRMAKPLPQAFMSTGLISKRNRNVDVAPSSLFSSIHMPDTPSKKAHIHIAPTPAASGLGKLAKPRHEFGSPSTPFSGRVSRFSPDHVAEHANIFGSRVNAPQLTRRGSFLGMDSEDINISPVQKLERQSSSDDLPPTPTKSTSTTTRPQSKGKSNSLRSSLFGRRTSLGPDTFASPAEREQSPTADEDNCKYSPDASPPHVRLSEPPTRPLIYDAPPAFLMGTTNSALEPVTARRLPLHTHTAPAPSPLAGKSYRKSQAPLASTSGAPTKIIPSLVSSPEHLHRSVNKRSPHTPHESFTPPDPSSLSISADHRASLPFSATGFPPATPTGPRTDSFGLSLGQVHHASSGYFANDVDTALTSRFGHAVSIGIGEFSQVYRVRTTHAPQPPGSRQSQRAGSNVWAVKKSRRPYTGARDRQHKLREVQILKALAGHEHVVEFVDHWEAKNYLYIQTEYCENGNLKDFLTQTGFKGRLDDFRIWKILLELCKGVKSIHDARLIHLDLKPANVFIDWEGVLKIGDFGMASTWPAPPGLDGEGDREYIGPEVLSGRFDKPADIFSLGMIMLEIAGNIVLPDNGTSWQRLRSGDISDLPSLTSSDSSLVRDDSGDPIDLVNGQSNESLCASNPDDDDDDDDDLSFLRPSVPKAERSQDLVSPPNFMVDSADPQALDQVVQWMINPKPDRRPSIDQLLAAGGVRWVEQRRRAGATVFEGNWGPADDVLNHGHDVEMVDADGF